MPVFVQPCQQLSRPWCRYFFVLHYTGVAPTGSEVVAIISLRYVEMSSLMNEIGDDDALLEVLDEDVHNILQDKVGSLCWRLINIYEYLDIHR